MIFFIALSTTYKNEIIFLSNPVFKNIKYNINYSGTYTMPGPEISVLYFPL